SRGERAGESDKHESDGAQDRDQFRPKKKLHGSCSVHSRASGNPDVPKGYLGPRLRGDERNIKPTKVRLLPAQPLDARPAASEFFLEPLEPADEMIDAVDVGFALPGRRRTHPRNRITH